MAQLAQDPAQLEGEALRTWYQRPASAIQRSREAERQAEYTAYFNDTRLLNLVSSADARSRQTKPRADERGAVWDRPDWRKWRSAQQSQLEQVVAPPSYARNSLTPIERTAATISGTADCVSCHGRVTPPIPGIPPGFIVFKRNSGSSGNGGGGDQPRRSFPQCELQYQNDGYVCNSLASPVRRAKCWESASERKAYCNQHRGEIGWPPLLR